MAEFIQVCPHCNGELQVQDEWSGMEINCPLCQNKIIVAQPVLQTFSDVATASQYGLPQPTNEKQCPFCGGAIKEQAVICMHCGQEFDDFSQGILDPQASHRWLAFWNILFPGAGHIYLGQIAKGLTVMFCFELFYILFFLLFTKGIIWTIIVSIIFGTGYLHVILDSFFVYAKFQVGESVRRWEWFIGSKAKKLIVQFPPKIQKEHKSLKAVGIGAGFFGINSFILAYLLNDVIVPQIFNFCSL